MAPVAAVSVECRRGVGGGDLVLGCGESGTFGGVFALAADRTFGGVVHREAFREIPSSAIAADRAILLTSFDEEPLVSAMARGVAYRNVGLKGNLLAVLSWGVA